MLLFYVIQLPDGKVDSLPVNFFLNNLLSLVSLHGDSESCALECDICDSGDPLVNRCATCSHFLCEFCSQAHRRGRNSRSHSLVSLEEAKKMAGSMAVTKPSVCKEHDGEVLKLFCETCDEAICRDCTIVKHREHKYTFVKDAFVEKKESVLKILSQTKGKAELLKEAINRVSEMRRSVELHAEQTVQQVTNTFQKQTACLNARCEELIHGVQELKKAKQKSLEVQQEELESALCGVQSSVEFTEKALENGSEVEILNMCQKMSSRLQELNSAIWKLEPCAHDVFRFHADDQLYQVLASYGTITNICTDAGTSTVTMGHGLEGLMYNAIVRQLVEFTITAREMNGMKRAEGCDKCEVKIFAPKGKSKFNDVAQFSAKDVGNGTYSFNFTPNRVNVQYQLSAKLNDCHVKGSPYIWPSERWRLCTEKHDDDDQREKVTFIHLEKDSRVATCVTFEENDQDNYEDTDEESDENLDEEADEDRFFMTIGDLLRRSAGRNQGLLFSNEDTDEEADEDTEEDADEDTDTDSYEEPDEDLTERLTVFGTSSFHVGKHLWKAKLSGEVSSGFSFGVGVSNDMRWPCKAQWMWEEGEKYQPSSHSQKSTLQNCVNGDIIEFYLNCDNRTLTIYNQRTKEGDSWEGIKGKVRPMFEMSKDGHEISLPGGNLIKIL